VATILFTWELGLAMGHAGRLRPLAEALVGKGHRVIAAIKDVTQAANLSPSGAVQCVQAPVRLNSVRAPFQLPSTFAHILHNAGFGAVDELRPFFDAWRSLYDLVSPDLILCEHSPTALLASQTRNVRRMIIGTGFSCPPDRSPLPDWRPYLKNDPARLAHDEAHVRSVINELLLPSGLPPLGKITDLYSRTDETVLATFPELDHFGPRAGARYWGTWPGGFGGSADWPSGNGRRVFGYLKPFAALPSLLERLVERRLPTVIFGPQIDRPTQDRFQCETLRFAPRPIDLGEAGKWCDLAILNATHATTASMLLAGKPMLQIPLFLEQQLSADNVVRMGAGLTAGANKPAEIVEQLEKLLIDDKYADSAREFSRRHAGFDWREQLEDLTNHVDRLVQNA
jgi:hypothetical protein